MGVNGRQPRGGLQRLVDIVGAAVLIVLSAPLLLVGIVLVAVTKGRPIFFGHERVGLGGRPFRCWKLRTMKVGAERALDRDPALMERYKANGFKLPNGSDPRITPVGRLLRRTYVDEIPQLVNVLRGEMSLVGPRPWPPSLVEQQVGSGLDYRNRITAGWTGPAQVRKDVTAPESYAELDLQYVEACRTFSSGRLVRLDVSLLWQTVRLLARGEGLRF